MIWPLRKQQERIEAEKEDLRQDIARAQMIRSRLIRQWPAVESLRRNLVERRLENGFGEELEVAFVPRRGGTVGDVGRSA